MELICSGSDYYNASTIANLQKCSKITCLEWTQISYQLANAVKYMQLTNFLHNDIKANVLLKLKEGNWIPKLTGKRKITLKSEPEVYRLSASQT